MAVRTFLPVQPRMDTNDRTTTDYADDADSQMTKPRKHKPSPRALRCLIRGEARMTK